jgi:hypothetical protein
MNAFYGFYLVVKERFVRGRRPAPNLQFDAALTLAEARSDFSNYYWPPVDGCDSSHKQPDVTIGPR